MTKGVEYGAARQEEKRKTTDSGMKEDMQRAGCNGADGGG